MKLFDRFRKKPTVSETTVPVTSATTPTPLSADRNFVDDLVSYFSTETAVTAAYFGFAYNNASKAHILVLAIDHQGDEDSIQEITWMIKSQFMSDTEIYYTSGVIEPQLTDYIRQHNLPFYHKDNSAILQQKVMKQWFDEKRFRQELIETMKDYEVFTLAHKMEDSKDLMLATYVREHGEFIPLFANAEMIARSGMVNIPDDRMIVKMTFQRILSGINPGQLFILNPATPFEAEIRV